MIVTDAELQNLITRPVNPLLTGFDVPRNWQDGDSLVQPCSVDLHIGAVFQPGIKPGKAGSAGNPKSELVLRTGQTAIVATQESIHLPADYAAFGFPPSKNVSSRALLMTNPGHIDPGYSGQLHFTVINMGRGDFVLRNKDVIVTLLIFRLANPAAADYAARNAGHISGPITQSSIDLLAPDFVDVQKRATDIAKGVLGISTVGASVLAIILSLAVNVIEKRADRLDERLSQMQTQQTQLNSANADLAKELQSAKEQLEKQIEIDRRLTVLESGGKTKGKSQ